VKSLKIGWKNLMRIFRNGLRFARRHLAAPAARPPFLQVTEKSARPDLAVTGDELIHELSRAIAQGQSVLLTGPRGCGKSHCIEAAIKRWRDGDRGRRDIIKLQGNREVGRDFLMESSISFFVYEQKGDRGKQLKVMPRPSPAPILKFAEMENDFTLRPKINKDPSSGDLTVQFGTHIKAAEPNPDQPQDDFRHVVATDPKFRFVLFLDEINRFPDGVLDSLLSIIEEGEVYFEGTPIKVPVTVVMTMNPPGYDATARQLSPPLLARIGRSWKMGSPDLDAMSDTIVAKKNRERTFHVDPMLVRKASLATLCLWGDPDVARGTDYLTAGSLSILREIMKQDPLNLAPAMRMIASLSRFGPDGRAAAEWIRSASAFAAGAELDISHFEETALATLSHRIYDNFSQASAPEKTAAKEEAIMVIVRSTLLYDEVAEKAGVLRTLDDVSGARLAAKLGELRKSAPAEQKSKTKMPTSSGRPSTRFLEHAARIVNWRLFRQALSPSPVPPIPVSQDQPVQAFREALDYRALRERLVAAGIRTDSQLVKYEALRVCMENEPTPADLADAGYLVQEFEGDHQSANGIPRLHPDGLCYLQIHTDLTSRNTSTVATTPMVNVWDDAANLPGVRRFVELGKRTKGAASELTIEQVARQFRRLMMVTPQSDDAMPANEDAFAPTQRIDFYIAALWLNGLHQMARGSSFSAPVEVVKQSLKSLRHRLAREARHYRALCNKTHPLFLGPESASEEDARLLAVRRWLFRMPLLQERRFLLEFLGITRHEFILLSAGA
jgi:MoxR-like ATPase